MSQKSTEFFFKKNFGLKDDKRPKIRNSYYKGFNDASTYDSITNKN